MVYALDPARERVGVATLGTGYASLLLLAATLSIGPWRILRGQAAPLNIDLRRDLGIWAALSGLVHVVLGLQMHFNGDWVRYFFVRTDRGLRLLLNFGGLANHAGLLATALLAALLLVSNDVGLRRLGASRWKRLQQGNYPLVLLTVAHTAAYQVLTRRPWTLMAGLLLLSAVLAGLQGLGMKARRGRGLPPPGPDAPEPHRG